MLRSPTDRAEGAELSIFPDVVPILIGAEPRDPRWPSVRMAYVVQHAACAACGATKKLNVHHKKPFHLFPALELDPTNFITLCESESHNCHLLIGHCLNWSDYNPKVEELAAFVKACMTGRLSA